MKESTTKFPEPVEHKGCIATIYKGRHRGKQRYEVRCNCDGRMQRHTFKTYGLARKFAIEAVRQIAEDRSALVSLRGIEAVEYSHVRDMLAERKLSNLEAVRQMLSITRRLGDEVDPMRVVEEWLKQQPKQAPDIRAAQVVAEFIEHKEKAKEVGKLHLRDLSLRLNRFAKAFDCPFRLISQEQLFDYINKQEVAPRTRKNVRNTLNNLYGYARFRGYLADSHPGLPTLNGKRRVRGKVSIFTPDELANILAAAGQEVALPMVLTAFSGIRAEEVKRLDWTHVHLEERFVEVPADDAKTENRRLAPIPDNLVAFLEQCEHKKGPLSTYTNLANAYLKAARKAGVKWRRNGLRHSFISYRTAAIKNIPQVALEAGNSPKTVQQDYLHVVTPKEAERWFTILPGRGVSVVQKSEDAPIDGGV
jgi:integrase